MPGTGTRGWVFFCNNGTQEENLRRCVVGAFDKYLARFHDLLPGDPVLLYNIDSGHLVAHLTAAVHSDSNDCPEGHQPRMPNRFCCRGPVFEVVSSRT